MADALTWTHLAVSEDRAFAYAETGDGRLTMRPPSGCEPCAVEFAPTGVSHADEIGFVHDQASGKALFDEIATSEVEGYPEAILAAAGFVARHTVGGWAGPTVIMMRDTKGGCFVADVSPIHVAMAYERNGEDGQRNLFMMSTRSRLSDEPVPAVAPARFGGMPGFASMAVAMADRYVASGATVKADPRRRAPKARKRA